MKTPTPMRKATPNADACCAPGSQPIGDLSLTGDVAGALADRLKALADPTRLLMLDLLAQQETPLCVCEITERFPQRQPTISHHLRLLREAGLIAGEKRGVWSYYQATAAGRRSLEVTRALAS